MIICRLLSFYFLNSSFSDIKGVMQTADWKMLDPDEYARLKDKIIEAYIKFNETNIVEPSLCEQQMNT